MIKTLAVVAGAIAVVIIAALIKNQSAQSSNGVTDNTGGCDTLSLKRFISAVDEALNPSIAATEGAGDGGFSGHRVNTTGYPDQPNVITDTGATKIINNPVLEWTGTQSSGQVPQTALRRGLIPYINDARLARTAVY